MPRVIQQTFTDRIRRSTVLSFVLNDLKEVSGLKVHFYSVSGDGLVSDPPCYEHSSLCRHINQRRRGARLCSITCRQFLEDGAKAPLIQTCAAGTSICVVPVSSSVGLLGYLVAAGYYSRSQDLKDQNKTRHLLERSGIAVSPNQIAMYCEQTAIVSPQRQASLLRILEIAAGYLVKELSLELFQKGGDLPPPLRKACELIRENFRQDPRLDDIAAEVGLSRSHFSRLFHERTGLRFKEYLNEVRLQYVRKQLRETQTTITQIAFDAGYHTLSQFNRQFKSHYNLSPKEYRKRHFEQFNNVES